MGDIGDELAALGLHLGQGGGHGVESLCQGAHLVAPVLIACDPHVELPLPEFPGGLCHLVQRTDLMGGGDGTGDHGDEQHRHSGKEKDGGGGTPHLGDAGSVGGDQHQPLRNGGSAEDDAEGVGGQIPLLGVDAVQVSQAVVGTAGQHLLEDPLRDAAVGVIGQVGGAAAGGIDDIPVHIGEQHVGVGDRSQGSHIAAEVDIQAPRLLDIFGSKGGDIVGVALHGVPLFCDDIAVGEHHESGGQHEKGEKDDGHHHEQLALIQAFQGKHLPQPGVPAGETSNL